MYDIKKSGDARTHMAFLPAIVSGATATDVIFVAPAPCEVTSVSLTYASDISQADTNMYNLFYIENKAIHGSTIVSGTIVSGTTKTTTGWDINAYREYDLGTLSTTNKYLCSGAVVVFQCLSGGLSGGADVTVGVCKLGYRLTDPQTFDNV